MRYIILTTLLLSCVINEDNPTEASKKGAIPITYQTSTSDLNVTFCLPDGSIDVIYGTIGFDTTLYFNSGDKVCLSAEESRDNYLSVVVTIYRDSSRIFFDKGDDKAGVSGYLE